MARKSSNRSKKPLPLIELTREDADRFWLLVDIRDENECWRWLGGIQKETGYGQFGWAYQGAKAHRISFRLFWGADPFPCLILHTCDHTWCVNPHHMSLGNNLDNSRDMVAKGRSSHGEAHPRAKITYAISRQIKAEYQRYVQGKGSPALAKKYGISHYAVLSIIKDETWQHDPR